jgi:hypothetical protein
VAMLTDLLGFNMSDTISLGIAFFALMTLLLGLIYIINSYIYFYKPGQYLKLKNEGIENKFIKAMQEGLRKRTITEVKDIRWIYEAIT